MAAGGGGGAHSPLPRLGWKIHRKRTQMDRPWGVGEDRMRAEGLSHFLCAEDGPEGLPLPLAPPPTQGPPFRPPATSIQPWAPAPRGHSENVCGFTVFVNEWKFLSAIPAFSSS